MFVFIDKCTREKKRVIYTIRRFFMISAIVIVMWMLENWKMKKAVFFNSSYLHWNTEEQGAKSVVCSQQTSMTIWTEKIIPPPSCLCLDLFSMSTTWIICLHLLFLLLLVRNFAFTCIFGTSLLVFQGTSSSQPPPQTHPISCVASNMCARAGQQSHSISHVCACKEPEKLQFCHGVGNVG